MAKIVSTLRDIRNATKTSVRERRVSPLLINAIFKLLAALWAMCSKAFLVLYRGIYARLQKILPLPKLPKNLPSFGRKK